MSDATPLAETSIKDRAAKTTGDFFRRRRNSLTGSLAGAAMVLLVASSLAAPIQWTQRIGLGTGYRYGAAAITADHSGDLILSTRVTHNPQAGNPDFYLYVAKHSGADGHLVWEYTAPPTGATSSDLGGQSQIDSANNVVVANRHDSRIHLVKFRGADGHVLWEAPRVFDFFNTSDLVKMKLDANDDVIVTGTRYPAGTTDGSGYFLTAKYSGVDGHVIWQQTYGAHSYPRSMAVDGSGNVIVAGEARRPGSQEVLHLYDYFVTKYDAADGRVLWERRLPGTERGHADLVAVAQNGDALVFGAIGADQYAIRLAAADGEPLWTQKTVNVPRRELKDIAVDKNSEVIVVGHDAFGPDPWTYYVAKHSGADGTVLWERRTGGGAHYWGGEALALKLAADGTPHVQGMLWFSPPQTGLTYQSYTAIYAANSGSLLWEQRYVPPDGHPFLYMPSLALLPGNDLAISGSEADGRNLIAIKYSTASQLMNISTRANVRAGDNALIGGFIVTGESPKKVLVRAIGPSLAISGALQDPVLELHKSDGTVLANDNWRDTQEAEITASAIPPTNDKESAVVASVPPGPHTAIVRDKNGGNGIGLVEIYDIDGAAPATAANISTRARVETGDNVLIGGVILRGPRPSTILIRAIGPALVTAGVQGALQDPVLELVDGNGNSRSNDDWKRDTSGAPDPMQQSRIENTGAAPKDDRESALLVTLGQGPYTAIVRGKNNTTGIALVEVYHLQ